MSRVCYGVILKCRIVQWGTAAVVNSVPPTATAKSKRNVTKNDMSSEKKSAKLTS